MADDPEKTLQELRMRIATEGLPKLSAEALRSYKHEEWRCPRLTQPTASKPILSLSPEALRLFREKADPAWLWKRTDRFFMIDKTILLDLPSIGAAAVRWPIEVGHPTAALLSPAWLETRMAC